MNPDAVPFAPGLTAQIHAAGARLVGNPSNHLYRQHEEAQRAFIDWFAAACLPMFLTLMPGERWRLSPLWKGQFKLRSHWILDHQCCFSIVRPSSRYNSIVIGQPYLKSFDVDTNEPIPIDLCREYGMGKTVEQWQAHRLPNAWSWWCPGGTAIFAVAPQQSIIVPDRSKRMCAKGSVYG